ncbi:bacteriorhodopsin-like [Deinococcus ruber]|uniref:Xanthorhodopsin n=1 Tax=Deinococcus ruber TaxID=1848197 RepID=A0A918CFF3_9DEIO|nr:bacteriorhodopsin-like [Deinococcus ruber]GGR19346.1 xanthorhodopsin [Deinococcus ruber]
MILVRIAPLLVLLSGLGLAQNVAPATLTSGQFSTVYNFFSFAIAAMGAAAIFFFVSRSEVGPKYRIAMLVSGLVVSIAGYHYLRIFNSWDAAYTLKDGAYVFSSHPFNDAYRYVDWLLTVPLLLLETVAVLALPAVQSRSLIWRMVIASALMIALGYPGEIGSLTARFWWGLASTVPFVYILWLLWGELGRAAARQKPKVQLYSRNMKLLLLFSWGVYPVAYALPMLGITGGDAVIGVQIGYTIADVLAKPIFGLLAYAIAITKTRQDLGLSEDDDLISTPPVVAGLKSSAAD